MHSLPARLLSAVLFGTLALAPAVRGQEAEEKPAEAGKPAPKPHVVPAPFANRVKRAKFKSEGGSKETVAAVRKGLDWLARHQADDGSWGGKKLSTRCSGTQKCKGESNSLYAPGLTGLALLAFLADGNTHESGDHRLVVKKGVRYLKKAQDPVGCFGMRTTPKYLYNHAAATLAFTEIYALTGSELFRAPIQKAIECIEESRNPNEAWRYGRQPGDSDTSVTGWMMMALLAARDAGFTVSPEALLGGADWLDEVTDPESGRIGYRDRKSGESRPSDTHAQFPPKNTESLTAFGMLIRIYMAEKTRSEKSSQRAKLGRDALLALPPRWMPKHVDMYYWHFGSLAMFQIGGKSWKTWNRALKKALLPNQRDEWCPAGSWDPDGPWGPEGGRIYSTALCTLMLQTCYRYTRLSRK